MMHKNKEEALRHRRLRQSQIRVDCNVHKDSGWEILTEAGDHLTQHFATPNVAPFSQDSIMVIGECFVGHLANDPAQKKVYRELVMHGDMHALAHVFAKEMQRNAMLRYVIFHAISVWSAEQETGGMEDKC